MMKGGGVMRRLGVILGASVVILGSLPAYAQPLPERIELPDGFFPEGVAVAPGGRFFTGSLITGAVYSGNVRTGRGRILVSPRPGRVAAGMKFHRGLVWVAGGETGQGYVYDARTGADVAVYDFEGGFVNDVVVTQDAAWFTDSLVPVLYRVPIRRGGRPGSPAHVKTLPLRGDIVFQEGFNVNGIDATPNGKTLIIVQSNTGQLFTVASATGVASRIDLGGDDVMNGDGILLDGKTLYVVQNFDNLLAKVRLRADLASGSVVSRIVDDDFDVPTTVAEFGSALVVANARFTTPPGPNVEYWLAVVRKARRR
jgi:hypothetical protein